MGIYLLFRKKASGKHLLYHLPPSAAILRYLNDRLSFRFKTTRLLRLKERSSMSRNSSSLVVVIVVAIAIVIVAIVIVVIIIIIINIVVDRLACAVRRHRWTVSILSFFVVVFCSVICLLFVFGSVLCCSKQYLRELF